MESSTRDGTSCGGFTDGLFISNGHLGVEDYRGLDQNGSTGRSANCYGQKIALPVSESESELESNADPKESSLELRGCQY